MVQKEFCSKCGQPVMKHSHCFSKSLGNLIYQVARKFGAGTPFHLQKDLSLTKNQYNNFQKFRYWGLAEKYRKDGVRRGGYWCLTEKVAELFRGGKVPKRVVTFNNEVREVSDEKIGLGDAVGYYDLPEVWARRAEPVHTEERRFKFRGGESDERRDYTSI